MSEKEIIEKEIIENFTNTYAPNGLYKSSKDLLLASIYAYLGIELKKDKNNYVIVEL